MDGKDGRHPARILLSAILWFALAIVASFTASFVLGFGSGFLVGLHHHPDGASIILSAATGPAAGFTLQAMLLLAAWRQSRPPRGDGLGAGPVQRPVLLAALAVGQLFATVLWAIMVVRLFGAPSTVIAGMLRQTARTSPWLFVSLVVLTTVVAPICEEAFFRGWLWTSLRRRWRPTRIAFVTALPWLLLHAADGGWRRVAILIPAAILFSIARQSCGSVRASIIMHVTNNGAAALLVALLAVFGK